MRERRRVDEFQVRLYTAEGIRDEIEVLGRVLGFGDGERCAELGRRAGGGARGAALPRARGRSTGSLPRFELKAKRLTDEREVWGGKGERKVM